MYRANVAAVIINERQDRILMFRRLGRGSSHGSWQFPQGGVDSGESETEALIREVEEEIGTRDFKILKVSKKHTRYHYPPRVQKLKRHVNVWKNYKGQQQLWFLIQLNQGVESISFEHEPPEFDAYKWVKPRAGLKEVIGFKQKAYKKGLKLLGVL